MRFRIIILAAMFLLAGISAGYSNPLLGKNANYALPVNFTAQSLTHDDENQTVTAIGDVELDQGQQILHADKIVYYLQEDRVVATGNVSLLDDRGDVHFAEYVELHNNMKDGFVRGLLSLLTDGSRFTAAEAKRENGGKKTTLTDATYTLCKVCELDPHPLWQIKAKQIVHDADAKTVDYKNARLELLGVPIAWSPIFSHPDPTQKQKSGFLRPEFGWSTALGGHLKAGYYYDIAQDKDMTLTVEPTMLAGTLLGGEWRERFANGQLKIDGSTVNSVRKEESGVITPSEQRGNIFADGRFDINDEWRTGFDLARVSDKQYLQFYGLSNPNNSSYSADPNVLNNQIYAERFSGRDYSRISAFNFQDLRLGTRPEQPDILPMMEHNMLGEPGALWGGRWQSSVSALGLARAGNNQDVQRGSVDAGWERRGISSLGFSNIVRLDGRGDYYAVENSDAAKLDPALDSNPTTARGMATASLISSYPLVKSMEGSQAVIEPVAGISLSPTISQNNTNVPNEDSIDIQFDTNSLFQQNRFPGIDRQEDGGRLNYGVKTGLYENDGRFGKIFLGQSYRLYGNPLFPQGSGLENRSSDTVGQIQIGISKYLDADYRFQIDSTTLAFKRHEVQAGGGNDDFRLNTRYLYTAPVIGTGFTTPRQQIQLDGTYNITKNWQFHALGLVDLVGQPGFRNASAGVDYSDECFTFSVTGSRNVLDSVTGDSGTKLMVRIGLKSLGEFAGPKIQLDQKQPK